MAFTTEPRTVRRARWSCFWRWPLGHRWEHIVEGRSVHQRCRSCSKTRGHWSPDSRDSEHLYGGGAGD